MLNVAVTAASRVVRAAIACEDLRHVCDPALLGFSLDCSSPRASVHIFICNDQEETKNMFATAVEVGGLCFVFF